MYICIYIHIYIYTYIHIYIYIYIYILKNFISLLTNYMFTGSSTRRLPITDGGYHII